MTTNECNDYNNYKDNMKCILNGAKNDEALFEKELIILEKLNKFNKYHVCHIRKTYNDDIYPDSQIYLNDEKCEDYDYSDASMAQLYNEIIKEIDEMTELFNDSDGNTNNVDMATLNSLSKSNNDIRNDLEIKMNDLKGVKGSLPDLAKRELDGTVYASILWTTMATCLIYYTFTAL